MSVVNFFLNSHSWTPEGISKVFWVSMASLLDIGQVPSTKGAGSHIVLLGWLFFILVRTCLLHSSPLSLCFLHKP